MSKNNKRNEIIKVISEQGILPLFYHDDLEVSKNVIQALYQGGFRAIEYTNRGNKALGNFKAIKEFTEKLMPDLYVGIGTIKTWEEGKSFLDAKADFIVSPIVDENLGDFCYENGVLWIPGCFSPTEVHVAQTHHAGIVKLFPSNGLHPEFLSAIRSVFPSQLFMPTGGVELEEEQIKSWFKAGVCAVGLGSNLIKREVLETKNYVQLRAKSEDALTFVNKVRGLL